MFLIEYNLIFTQSMNKILSNFFLILKDILSMHPYLYLYLFYFIAFLYVLFFLLSFFYNLFFEIKYLHQYLSLNIFMQSLIKYHLDFIWLTHKMIIYFFDILICIYLFIFHIQSLVITNNLFFFVFIDIYIQFLIYLIKYMYKVFYL